MAGLPHLSVTSSLSHSVSQVSQSVILRGRPAAPHIHTHSQAYCYSTAWLGLPACLPAVLHACMVVWSPMECWSVVVCEWDRVSSMGTCASYPYETPRLRAHVGGRWCDRPQCYWVRQLDYCSTIGPLVCRISALVNVHCVCIVCICAHACAYNKWLLIFSYAACR